jgi:uncharacterized protein
MYNNLADTRITLEEVKQDPVVQRIIEELKPIFLMLSGSHNFGFPSSNSDLDIKGVFVRPTDDIVGFGRVSPVYEYKEGELYDIALDEIGHNIGLVANSNGNRIEWPHSNLIIHESPEFPEYKKLIMNSSVSRQLFNHYSNFARDTYSDTKTNKKGVKRDLYTIRVYMTGIHALETGELVTDVNILNQQHQLPIVNQMIIEKQLNGEHAERKAYSRQSVDEAVAYLETRLQQAFVASSLPTTPNRETLNQYLIQTRKHNFI